jgi:GrpB-like predicted nucleotidyltransferase (UPF0157 family)
VRREPARLYAGGADRSVFDLSHAKMIAERPARAPTDSDTRRPVRFKPYRGASGHKVGHRTKLGEMSIEIRDYDPRWVEQVSAIVQELSQAMPGTFTRIEHIGSTSVPGLAAKPIIDLMAGVEDLQAATAQLNATLPSLQYFPEETGMRGRLFFLRYENGRRVCHFHVVPAATLATRNEILLRDLLRSHPHHAERYAELKRALAASFADDGIAYTRGKTDLIQQLVDEAREAAGLAPVSVWED